MRFKSWLLSCCVGLIFLVTSGLGANILFFIHVNNYSHRHTLFPLAEAMAARGHNVTFLSGIRAKEPHPNVTEFTPINLEKHLTESLVRFDVDIRIDKDKSAVYSMERTVFDYGYDACVVLYDSPDFQTWLHSKPSVDLVIVDQSMCMECGIGLAYKLGAKYMVFTTLPVFAFEYDIFGYAPESSAIPEMEMRPHTVPMSFFTRVSNALMSVRWHYLYCVYSDQVDKLVRDKLGVGKEMPHVQELVGKASLILSTGDVITDYPKALPPNHIRIPGINCKDSVQPLPKNLEVFLNSGESDGFVYISLGSLINPSNLPVEIKQRFFNVIRSLPQLKFLWRWNTQFPEDAPKNVMFSKWFPQNDVLARKKIRAFVTQGGRPSTLEAVWHGVPMISFAFVADQDYNINRMVEWGVTTKLEIGTFTEQELKEAIHRAAYDSEMRLQMTQLKNLFRDRRDDPLDTAVWWTEYVLRNPDTSHLRPAGHGQSWFVRRQIDIWAFLTVSFLVVLFCVTKIVITAMTMVFPQSKQKLL